VCLINLSSFPKYVIDLTSTMLSHPQSFIGHC
jgi:hypothetical protein